MECKEMGVVKCKVFGALRMPLTELNLFSFYPSKPNKTESRKKILQKFISCKERPMKSIETKQGLKHARRLLYYRNTTEKTNQ